MSSKKIRMIGFAALCGFFVFFDQVLKNYAINHQQISWYIFRPWFGWEYFSNSGVAFSLPIPQWRVLTITPCALLLITIFCINNYRSDKQMHFFASTLILSGALSNYIDRVIFAATIDYIRVATGVINIADILIFFGVTIFLLAKEKRSK